MAKGKEKWQFWNKKNALSFNSFELFWCTSIWKKTRLIGKELMNEKIIFSTFYCLTKRFCHYAFSYQSFYSNFCLKCIDKIWILIFSWSSEIFHSNFNFKKKSLHSTYPNHNFYRPFLAFNNAHFPSKLSRDESNEH